ncbi:MAG: SusF/SusE family outer membrane protein [Cytophagia bacterium]|nr:SusF/SusE family outer membrane protein [Cytophagia bacterium]
MIKTTKLLLSFMVLAMAVAFTACDDETNIGGGDGIPVGDGFYITLAGQDPTISSQLMAEKVEADGFGSQVREGFFSSYVFLTAGSYNIVSIIDQKLNKTYGGTIASVGTTGSDCELHSYLLIEEFVENGAAFNVPASGLYKVGFDNLTKEILLYKIEKAQVIGAASPAGWSSNANQDMVISGTASGTGVKFEKAGIEMRPGEYKIRFNCRWSIDRRIDPAAGFAATNGYVTFTNFGGTFAALAPGGSNFSISEGGDGIYTITAQWTPENGFVLSATKTQTLEPIQFDPTQYAWGIIGAATSTGWDSDTDLNYEGKAGNTYTWRGTFTLTAGEFKFRTNNAWTFAPDANSGKWTLTGPDAALVNATASNFSVAAGGSFQFTITTNNDGDTWTLNVDKQ